MSQLPGSNTFAINHPQAAELCASAQLNLRDCEWRDAKVKLVDALRARPSCALAFKLLGDAFDGAGDALRARQCRLNRLPDGLIEAAELNANAAPPQVFIREDAYPAGEHIAPEPGSIAGSPAFQSATIRSNACFVDTVSNGTVWHDDLNTLVQDLSLIHI